MLILLNRTLEDIDRFFETKPGIFIHRNKTAVQLQRPLEYIEADERIARGDGSLDEKNVTMSVKSDHIEAKEAV